jgi:hypothetical protein
VRCGFAAVAKCTSVPHRAALHVCYAEGVDDGFEARAAARRATWSGGVARTLEELDAAGQEFWARATPGQKLTAMLEMLTDAWVLEGKHGPAPRFQGSIVGVGRFER